MNYSDWEKGIPDEIRDDSLWKVEAYRLALFLADIGWADVAKIARDRRTSRLSGQLYDALGSIGANISEGFGRSSAKDRVRFYEYALGSARESRHWYHGSRHILGAEVASHRMSLVTQVVRLLLTMIPQQRGYVVEEDGVAYETAASEFAETTSELDGVDLEALLRTVPLPE